MLIVADDSFGPTEITYLEHAFYEVAKNNQRYQVMNSNVPAQGNITEEQKAELEEFVDYAKLVVATLGVNAFEPVVEERPKTRSRKTLAQKNPFCTSQIKRNLLMQSESKRKKGLRC